MAINGLECTTVSAWGQTSGSTELTFGASNVCMQCTINAITDTSSGWGYIAGIGRYQTHNFFGGPTTHDFTGDIWEIPNAVFDQNVINVTFYLDMWGDDNTYLAALGNIFFF
jgi:hypothetical protein